MRRTKEELCNMVERHKIIAIMRKVPMEVFEKTIEALFRGGIRLIEVTFDPSGEFSEKTTLAQIHLTEQKYQDIAVGAGTVLSMRQVGQAYNAGAGYIISPNVNEDVIRETRLKGMLSMPGAMTPTEAENAAIYGADFVKLFPAGTMGTDYIKDLKGPLSHIRFLAVGGVDETNLTDFLSAGCVGAGAGSCLVNKKLIKEGKFKELEELAARFVSKVN